MLEQSDKKLELNRLFELLLEGIKRNIGGFSQSQLEKIAKIVMLIDDGLGRGSSENVLPTSINQYEDVNDSYANLVRWIRDNGAVEEYKQLHHEWAEKIRSVSQASLGQDEDSQMLQFYGQKFVSFLDSFKNINGMIGRVYEICKTEGLDKYVDDVQRGISSVRAQGSNFLSDLGRERVSDDFIKRLGIIINTQEDVVVSYSELQKLIETRNKMLEYLLEMSVIDWMMRDIVKSRNKRDIANRLQKSADMLIEILQGIEECHDKFVYPYVANCISLGKSPDQTVVRLFQKTLQDRYKVSDIIARQIFDIRLSLFNIQNVCEVKNSSVGDSNMKMDRELGDLDSYAQQLLLGEVEVDDGVKDMINDTVMRAHMSCAISKCEAFFDLKDELPKRHIQAKYNAMYGQCKKVVLQYINYESEPNEDIDVQLFGQLVFVIGRVYCHNYDNEKYVEAYSNLQLLMQLITKGNVRYPRDNNGEILQGPYRKYLRILEKIFLPSRNSGDMSMEDLCGALNYHIEKLQQKPAVSAYLMEVRRTGEGRSNEDALMNELVKQEREEQQNRRSVEERGKRERHKIQERRFKYVEELIEARRCLREQEEIREIDQKIEYAFEILRKGCIAEFKTVMQDLQDDELLTQDAAREEKFQKLRTLDDVDPKIKPLNWFY